MNDRKGHSSSCTCPFSMKHQAGVNYIYETGLFHILFEVFYRRYLLNMEQWKCLLSLLTINLYVWNCRALGRETTSARVQEFQGIMDLGTGLPKNPKGN